MEKTISVFALIISFGSLAISFYIYLKTMRAARQQLNLQLLIESEKMLKDFDNLLALHDIETKAIRTDGITKEEFYYILTSFRSSESYFILHNRKKTVSKFRANFLRNAKVELVYKKYLKGKLIANQIFIEIIDEFYSKNACAQ